MSPDLFDERLSAYLDDELEPRERDEVEALLRSQPELARVLDQLRQIRAGMQQLPPQSLGPQFADRVAAAARQASALVSPRTRSGSRRGWLLSAIAALAATAALVAAILAWGPRQSEFAQPKLPKLSPAEQAVASALAHAGRGQAVVVRLRLTKDAIRGKALDQALADSGISPASAAARNPAAQETSQGYQSLAQSNQASGSAADVLFIEADPTKIQKALAALAKTPQGELAISTDGVVASLSPGIARSPKAEGEGGSRPPDGDFATRDYAQHLPPRGFPLLNSSGKALPAAPRDSGSAPGGEKSARVLVVVEVIP